MAELWSRVVPYLVGGGTRSDVLRALIWPNGMLLTALVYSGVEGTPLFILILLSALLVLFMLLYAAAYALFGRKDPNLLRSERYNIERMAIEHGLYGDSDMGLERLPNRPGAPHQIEAKAENSGE